ncbi:Electron transfer flavoprotein-ubiquinone oxidoreductase [Candidatus Sumerlaea chitinivorans]|uniref:Electron transfer flavoprotein-ubiquinone oxidoreductase n=1 Tax=Sumerlaea chitinivorans TaxID=2250252 RepID=A0A2Z4Y6V8_SUMC1|nr:Electron transfer flavoprotein-ubiquinone oxidoreductase [Candidatus Sumerlaea chitinivorans]
MESVGEVAVAPVERMRMDVDIVCVGFGPATAGFLTRLDRELTDEHGAPRFESRAVPGMPLQVICYERADDIGFGVSGVVTRARAIRAAFPNTDLTKEVPFATPVRHEEVYYLLDPIGASRRSRTLRIADRLIRATRGFGLLRDDALRLPWIPPFLRKHDGLLLAIGQFNQWVGSQIMGRGNVQIWPATPVEKPIVEDNRVVGVQLVDQGTDRAGNPDANYMPGMEIRAALTVIGDGPVGPVGRALDEHFGLPEGHSRTEWAVGMKVVIDLPPACALQPGTVIHTFGYPEPEIFGFLYVYEGGVASAGIFVPSWLDHPARTAYRYLQHWLMHPALWKHVQGGSLRSFGAKTLFESGRRGEPYLVGDGYARIGEGSGSTNVLTGSGVDEAWLTGELLAEAVLDLLRQNRPFTRENLERAYVRRRRASWLEREARIAEKSRDGFTRGFVAGLIGMGLTGLTKGLLNMPGRHRPPAKRIPSLEEYYRGKISPPELEEIRARCAAEGKPLHDALMDRVGWPPIPFDGKLLVSHQDALLIGGKVQAPPGYRDHVMFLRRNLCEQCRTRVCIEMCSGQAIMPGEEGGPPAFDREKCVHCGACLWNCAQSDPENPELGNIRFLAGAGGLHSAEN